MSKFRDEDEFNIDENQRYAFDEDYDLDDEDSGLDVMLLRLFLSA